MTTRAGLLHIEALIFVALAMIAAVAINGAALLQAAP
jgi:hypothetical protein